MLKEVQGVKKATRLILILILYYCVALRNALLFDQMHTYCLVVFTTITMLLLQCCYYFKLESFKIKANFEFSVKIKAVWLLNF